MAEKVVILINTNGQIIHGISYKITHQFITTIKIITNGLTVSASKQTKKFFILKKVTRVFHLEFKLILVTMLMYIWNPKSQNGRRD